MITREAPGAGSSSEPAGGASPGHRDCCMAPFQWPRTNWSPRGAAPIATKSLPREATVRHSTPSGR